MMIDYCGRRSGFLRSRSYIGIFSPGFISIHSEDIGNMDKATQLNAMDTLQVPTVVSPWMRG
jgi:hypothetical protein